MRFNKSVNACILRSHKMQLKCMHVTHIKMQGFVGVLNSWSYGAI